MKTGFLQTALLLSLAGAVVAAEWPQFRGPDGQGHSEANGLPLTWSETENVRWKTAIPGQGWSSPVISGSQIWLTTATGEGKSMRAVCVELGTGKLLKDVEVFHLETLEPQNGLNSYASPSPVIEAGRLYVHFGTYGTACLSTESGAILWQRRDLKLNHRVGPGSSPALWHDNLIVPCDGMDVDYVIGLNKQTGETVWKTDRAYKDGKRPSLTHSSCTPLVIEVNGSPQAVVPGAEGVFAYDPATGKPVWQVAYHGWSIVPRPVCGNGLVYICTGWGDSAIMAIRPEGAGDITAGAVAWKCSKDVPTQSSLLLTGNRLYAVTDEGVANCFDATKGAVLWRERLGGTFSASPLSAEGRVYFFDRKGQTTVVEVGDAFKVLAKNGLESGFMASPAVAENALILRTKTTLYRIQNVR